VHELPEKTGLEITAINFASTPVDEIVRIAGVTPQSKVVNVLDAKAPVTEIGAGGSLRVQLQSFAGAALRIGH
jgi:hypothetical protein